MVSNYLQFSADFPWFFPLAAFLLGACIGSFLNVVIYRIPKEESIVTPGSHCGCGQPIAWYDNIPILSWVLLRGRARCCGRAFSFRYPFVELLTGLLFLTCWLHYGREPAVAACGMLFLSCLVAATFIDLDHFIIPDVFTVGLAIAGMVLSFVVPELHDQHASSYPLVNHLRSGTFSLIGLLVGSGVVAWVAALGEAVFKKNSMGFGDVKFVGAIGAFCGWQGAVFTVFVGAIVGTLWFALALAWGKFSGRPAPIAPPSETPDGEPTELGFGVHVPFGPSLAVAGALYFLFFKWPFLHWLADSNLSFLVSSDPLP